MSVSHCRCDISVAEKFLQRYKVNAVHYQVTCESVSERVDVCISDSQLFCRPPEVLLQGPSYLFTLLFSTTELPVDLYLFFFRIL